MSQNQTSQTSGAWQQNPICAQIRQWIDDLRSELYAALSLDWFVILINDPETAITKDDVKACLKHDETVEIIDVNGREVLWLWRGQYIHEFVNKAVDLASKYGEAVVIAEI